MGEPGLTAPAPRPLPPGLLLPASPRARHQGPSLSPSGKRQPAPRPPPPPQHAACWSVLLQHMRLPPSKESLLRRERDESLFFTVRAQWGRQGNAGLHVTGTSGTSGLPLGDTFGCHKAGGVSPPLGEARAAPNTRPSTGPSPEEESAPRPAVPPLCAHDSQEQPAHSRCSATDQGRTATAVTISTTTIP